MKRQAKSKLFIPSNRNGPWCNELILGGGILTVDVLNTATDGGFLINHVLSRSMLHTFNFSFKKKLLKIQRTSDESFSSFPRRTASSCSGSSRVIDIFAPLFNTLKRKHQMIN